MTAATSLAPTLRLDDVRRLEAVRDRLQVALRTASTLSDMRVHVADLASDLCDVIDAETAPDTLRAPTGYPAPWEGDCAPPTPHASELGREYGV